MKHRFFAPDATTSDLVIQLPTDEGHHLARVLRLGPGAAIQIFDGSGRAYEARVDTIDHDKVNVRIEEALTAVQEPTVRLTLALALLKSRKLEQVVRDATTLGAIAFQPLVTARTEVIPTASVDRPALDRWFKIAVASAKQCGRAVVPKVHPLTAYDRFIETDHNQLRILLVEPSAESETGGPFTLGSLKRRPTPESAVLTVGPEGGWTAAELKHAEHAGFELLTMGARTLRADAAPIAALAVLQFLWGDM